MHREELERLDRDSLIAQAEQLGVQRARILTRPELVDELLLRTERAEDLARVRGFFGRARDLLARVVERGLHLPDAADRIRAVPAPSLGAWTAPAAPLPTVTLAEVYAAQGHTQRAIQTLRRVLEREPDHEVARAALLRLAGAPPPADGPAPPAEEPPPEDVARDGCLALPVDDTTVFVQWALGEPLLARARAELPDGRVAVRALVIVPTWEGPRSDTVDLEGAARGERVLADLPRGAVVRAAVGWRSAAGFRALAQSPLLERGEGDTWFRWTPAGYRPLKEDDPDVEAIAAAWDRARQVVGGDPGDQSTSNG